MKDAAGVCAQPKSGLTWGNTVEQEPRKMSKATSTSTSHRMWWRWRKKTCTRSWARWEKHWQYPVQGDIPLFANSVPPPPPPEYPPRLIINFVIIIAWLQFQFIWRCIIRIKVDSIKRGSTFIRDTQKERTSGYIIRNKLTTLIKRGSTYIRESEKERASSLCILSKSMLTNFCTESIFVKVLRRYNTHRSGRPLRINLMSRYICFSQNGRFDVSFEELFSKVQNPGGFFRKIVF